MQPVGERSAPVSLFESMLLIRRTEERLIHLAADEHQVRGHYHVYIGQEATGVAVCDRLSPEDFVFTTHRNHGHILARGGDPARLIAEILGRASGYNGGRGGTLHCVAPELGILHTSAIVGGSLPLAAGAAFSARQRHTGQLSVAFFGDGALEEGAFYEAINMAALWQLPLLLICENNSLPPHLRRHGQHPSSSLAARQLIDIPAAFAIPSFVADGTDLSEVGRIVEEMASRARRGDGPSFLEARTTRWPGNYPLYPTSFGVDTDVRWAWDPQGVPAALAEWTDLSDPVVLAARTLLQDGAVGREELIEIDRRIRARVDQAAAAAKAAPFPDRSTALEGIFAQEQEVEDDAHADLR